MTNPVCASCGRRVKNGATYDERAERYFCDPDCWQLWADANHDSIAEYYWRMNVIDEVTIE